jgi:hypothetical protein
MFSLYVWGKFINRCWTGRNSVTPQIRVTRFPTPHATSSSHSLELRRTTLGVGINFSSRTGGVRNGICISVDGGNYMYSPSTTPFVKPFTYGRYVLPGSIMNGEKGWGQGNLTCTKTLSNYQRGVVVVAVVCVFQPDIFHTWRWYKVSSEEKKKCIVIDLLGYLRTLSSSAYII